MLIVFALLTIVGSLAAWRASPLYSLKSTLKLGLATLLIPAVAVGAAMAIYDGPLKNAPVAQAVVGLFAYLLIATGAMVLIVRITDAHVAQLPPAVKLVNVHRHRVLRWGWRLIVYVLMNAGAALIVPDRWQWLPEMLGGFVLLICGPMIGLAYMMARRNDRAMSAIFASPWVHWQYTPQQWQQWIDNQLQWERAKQKPVSWRALFLFMLFCDSLFALGTAFDGGFGGENLYIFFGLCGLVVVFIAIMVAVGQLGPRRRKRLLLAAPPEAYFGDEGVFCNGEFTTWILSGRYLLSASVESTSTTCVILVFESYTGNASIQLYKRVFVPPDHCADLALLEKKLAASCPSASVNLAVS